MEARAHRVGDILTVSFTESFQATKSQNAASSKTSENTVTLPTVMGSYCRTPWVTLLSLDLLEQVHSLDQALLISQIRFRANICNIVVRVYPNGNLEILGQKKLTLNNGDEYIRVSGIVRPRDISSDNIVQSDRIANADINYVGAGDTARNR
ncbi:MAG: hypothetical protein CM15mP85_05230 [Rhodobacterales bacterium]|nr:MAG: hypothetical protein CM15mP85_05230 [Rhodobacterales bacterium]